MIKMKVSRARTWETIGHVEYKNTSDIPDTLPAFISIIDGKLATLKVGETEEMVKSSDDSRCLVYRLYEDEGRERLAKSGIQKICYDRPECITLDGHTAFLLDN